MPPKAGPSIWQDTAFLGDLALALYEAAHRAGGLSPPVKAAVEDALRKQGHETSWEAIRCVDFLPCVGALRRGPLSACPCLVSSPRPPFSLAPSLVSSAHLSFASIVPSLLSLLPLRAATHTPPDIELSIEANMSRQTMRWGPEVHQDILITLFQHASLTANDWSKVMEDLRAKGYTFSESALRQHVQKLRKGRDMSGIGKAAGGSTPTKASPAKAGTRQKKTPSKRSHKMFVDGGDGGDDDDDDEVKNLKEILDAEAKPKFPKTTRVKREESPDLASDGSGNEF